MGIGDLAVLLRARQADGEGGSSAWLAARPYSAACLLALTPEQLQKIDPMIDEAMHRVEAIRKETASQVFANVTTLHEQMLAVLTPEQKAKFEVLERERRERLLQKFGPATNSP